MTFEKQLHVHIGGLVRLKEQLYWYDSCVCDGVEGRVCLLLDVADADDLPLLDARIACSDQPPAATVLGQRHETWKVLLLIDGSPKWVWLSEDIVEFIE
jgi:hypothetical protein